MVTVLMVFNRKQMDQIVFWIMGSFTAASWRHVAMLAPVVIAGSAAIIAFSRDLNALTTGDDVARSLGIEVETVKKILLILSSVVVAACVSVSGIIGFVGLIIPHAVRLMLGSDHRVVLPFSVIGGALFMVFADTLARNLIPPAELPVGAITSLFGAPFFIYLLIKNKKKVA
jgi:iron complex transport system permease protein